MSHRKLIPIILIILFILPNINSLAQQTVQITLKPLTIGDTLHGGIPLKLMNFQDKDVKIRDFSGKIVLLDFWEKYCQACINGLPKLQRLQDQFAGKLQVIAVTSSTEPEVRDFLERVEFLNGVDLPFAVENSLLDDVFPHRIIPHIVWIDQHGVVKAITGGEEVTAANIQALMEGKEINLPLKRELTANTVSEKEPNRIQDSLLLIRSVIQKASIRNGSGKISVNQETSLPYQVHFRANPIGMYYYIFSYVKIGLLGNINLQRVIIDVKDSLLYKRYANASLRPLPFFPRKFPYLHYNSLREFNEENLLEYVLTLPAGVPNHLLLKYVLADLNKFLPIKGRIERRKRPCWVITATDSAAALLKTNGGKSRNIYNSDSVGVINKPIDDFFYWLKHFRDAEPFFNESGIDFPVDLVVDFHDSPLRRPKSGLIGNSPLDRDMLKAALQQYGLNMKMEEREVDMLIIYD